MAKVQEALELVKGMTVVELAELVKAIEEEFDVSAAAPVAVAPAAGPAAGLAAEAEQVEFDVVLTGFGDQKIQVIKAVRELTGLGLKEAKDLVEGVPSRVKEKVSKEEADQVAAKLREVGATAEVK